MLRAIALFELSSSFRRMSTYVYFSLFFAIAFLALIAAAGAFPSVDIGMGAGGKVLANSPIMLFAFVSGLSYYGLLVVAAVMGHSGCQDFLHKSHPLIFTTPISKAQYLLGRFLAAAVILLFILSSIGLGCFAGSCMPFVDQQLVGPNRLAAYLRPYLLIVIPNTLSLGAIFFGIAALRRKMLPVYVSAVLIFVGYLIAATLSTDLENKFVAGIVDPFGNYALDHVTQYWTVAERNSRSIPLAGLLLINRLLWLAAGAAVLGLTMHRFQFAQGGEDASRLKDASSDRRIVSAAPLPATPVQLPRPFLVLLPRLTWREFRRTVTSVGFLLIVVSGVTFIFVSSNFLNTMYGTTVYPVTATVVDLASGTFQLFMLIIITVYSGQMVWREREAGMQQLYDVLPTPTWLPYLSKLLALMLVQALLLGVVMLSGIAVQVSQGYYKFELGLYLRDLFGLRLIDLCLLSVLAIVIQVLVNNKYLGHFVMVLYYLISAFSSNFGFEHRLYRYASDPGYIYSDMNGFGHFIGPIVWFKLYWAAFAMLLALAGNLFWVRGLESGLGRRLKTARARFTGWQPALTAAFLTALLGLGGFIYYNTNVLNEYRNRFDYEQLAADYETKYKANETLPQPRIQSVKINVDIYPAARRLRTNGVFLLANRSGQPISSVLVNLPREAAVRQLSLGSSAQPFEEDAAQGLYIFRLPQPLQPESAAPLTFDLEYAWRGFQNRRADTSIVDNGTFFNQANLPQIGYVASRELSEDSTRRKHGLAPKERMAGIDDASARRNNYISQDADWIDFEATLSTSADQIAVAPGSLQREWTENGRRYFHYKTDGKILAFYSFLSARYEVLRDRWNDVDIEIYYHPGHEYNLDSMVKAIKASLDYFTTNFSPYQHKQARILEFPRYQLFAQSYPNTIPYSEGVGFIARVDPRDEKDIDYPVYVTAHEIAHQWWAHQVVGGNVQGATMLSETLAQYSALMVMKKMFGPNQMKRFMAHELNQYLQGRGGERKKEMPLALVENQAYIHYNKGSLVMYALQDYIGEEAVNRALADFIQETAFQQPPYTTSRELIAHFRRAAPPELAYLIDDMFETITLFDNRAVSASYQQRDDGKFRVRLQVSSKKLRAGQLGEETEIPLNDHIDIGVLDKDGAYLYLQKHKIAGDASEIEVEVGKRPWKAGIDPLNILVDRKPDDNVVKVREGE